MNKGNVIFEAPERKEERKDELVELTPSEMVEGDVSDEDNLSTEVKVLLEKYQRQLEVQKIESTGPFIKVSEVLGSVAFLYERLRNAVDYKGEHLLRRNAIERILRRQIWEKPEGNFKEFSNSLVRELIWARYLKNDTVPEGKIANIGKVISKHLKIFNLISNFEIKKERINSNETKEWFLGVAAAEIEEILDSEILYMDALNASVFSWFKKNFEWQDENLNESEKDTQILIAVQRGLSKYDKERVRYHLLKVYYSDWERLDGDSVANDFDKLSEIRGNIEEQLASAVQPRIYRFVQRQSAAFQILKEIIEEEINNARQTLKNSEKLEKKIQKVCKKRYNEIGKRINRGITRSVVYIFLSKMLLALLMEIPFELFVVGSLNFLSLGINTVFPPFLMFLVGLSIKRPDEENTERIIEKIKSFVYRQNKKERFKFSLTPTSKSSITYKIFFFIYVALSLFVFTSITTILIVLKFNVLSGIIFFMFLSLVLLFGFRVRYTAGELNVTGEREGFISHLFTNLTLPFLNLGIWLSEGLAKFNFLVVLMDFLIEAPFKRIIKVFEEWTTFIRERKEEVVEVPSQV